MNESSPYDPKYLQVIYTSLLMMQFVMTVVVVYAAPSSVTFVADWAHFELILVPFVAMLLVFSGNYSWNKGMAAISEQDEMDEKLKILTNIHIKRWIAVELATMILLTYTLVESNYYYFNFALVNMIYFLTLRPKIFSFT